MKKLLLILSMGIVGAALSLAFPRTSLWPLAWVALAPLLILVRDSRPRTAALAGFAFGIGFFGVLLRWSDVFGYTAWILLTLKEVWPIALFGALASLIYRSRRQWLVILAVPALWTVVEWLRSLGVLGFYWGYLAHSQAQNLPAIQIASLTGTWGLTFVIALFNTALASPKGKILKSVVVAVLVTAVVHISGYWSMNRQEPQREKVGVAVAQGAVPVDPSLSTEEIGNHAISVYNSLTHEAIRYQPDLVVWPESSVPGDIVNDPEAREWITTIARTYGAYTLVGGPLYLPETESRPATKMNGAHMLSPDGVILDSYYKIRLAPFGEFVPGREWLPFLERFDLREVDIVAGKEYKLLPTSFGKAGVMICFESAFPTIARKETIDGADFLCVLSREVLFKKSAEAAQHHDLAIFRAVETRRFVIRSAESGISSIIDPCGRVQGQLGLWKRGVLYGEIEPRDGLTIYTRFGDWFVYLSMMIAVCGVGSGIAAQRSKKRKEKD